MPPIEERVNELLSKMTLEEKIAQTQCRWFSKNEFLDEKGNFNEAKAEKIFQHGLGHIARINEAFNDWTKGRSPKENARLSNQIQKFFIEKTRLGIPVIFHEESLHGQQAKNATIFPVPIALASTWNEEFIFEIFTDVAEEVRARGARQVLAPVVDIARDPRWGRTEETLGEDPYLTSHLAVAEVKAYQGDEEYLDKKKVAATLKHFGVHGWSEGGNNVSPSHVDEIMMREVFFPPFKACIQEAKVMNVMPCYNEMNGIPAHANEWLLKKILRKEWGFKGTIVSDYIGIIEMKNLHRVAETEKEAALLALQAGIDIELPDPAVYIYIKELIEEGKFSEEELNGIVSRVLTLKFRLGLFDDPYVDEEEVEKIVGSESKRAVALKAAEESIVLLKNENDFLPLDKNKIRSIALIGPNADRCILGAYSGEPKVAVTPLQAMKEKYGDKINVVYSEGVRITKQNSWFADKTELEDPEANRQRIKEAIEVAKLADVVVLCLGSNESTNREAWGTQHLGDLPTLELLSNQNDLAQAIIETCKTTCALIFSGAPLNISYINTEFPAVMQCWYLGQETGYAVANVLFGKKNPSGKLPISFPRSAGHIPCYYNYKPSARRGYHLGFDISPLYAFGHGLSYTTFAYSNPQLSSSIIKQNETTEVSINVTNTGNRSGVETVQLYIRDDFSSVTRPVKELKGFKKILLEAGETKTVTFPITPDLLSFFDKEMQWVAEPGDFTIMIGTASDNLQEIKLKVEE